METKRTIIYLLAIFFLSCEKNNQFFVDSINGNDNNSGSKNEPFYSLEKINDTKLTDGSSIFLANGSMFKGSINLINNKDITITNYIGRSESNDKPITEDRETLGFISIAMMSSFSSGLTANRTLHPPAKSPILLIILIAISLIF